MAERVARVVTNPNELARRLRRVGNVDSRETVAMCLEAADTLMALAAREMALESHVRHLTMCDCGRPLGRGQCGVCDNDD